jgi:excisionase family DNA binding protein
MEPGWYSVEQVAERLGLHVRTVRGYIRDGRLTAVRIGKQYRIARADLDAFTGRSATPAGRPRVEVSTIVEIDDISAATADRISTFLVAGAQLQPIRVRTVYDDERGRLKVIVLGGAAGTADVLQLIDTLLESTGSENPHD